MTEYDCLLHNMIFPGQQQFCWVGWADGNQGSRWHQPGNLPAAEVREFMRRELYTTHNHTSAISLVTYFALFAFCSFKLFSDFWCIVRNAYWRQKSGTKRKPCVRGIVKCRWGWSVLCPTCYRAKQIHGNETLIWVYYIMWEEREHETWNAQHEMFTLLFSSHLKKKGSSRLFKSVLKVQIYFIEMLIVCRRCRETWSVKTWAIRIWSTRNGTVRSDSVRWSSREPNWRARWTRPRTSGRRRTLKWDALDLSLHRRQKRF